MTVVTFLFILLLTSLILSISNLKKSEERLSVNHSDDEHIKLMNVYNRSSMFATISLPLSLLWFSSALIFFESYIIITVLGLIFLFLSTWLCRKNVVMMPRIYNGDCEYDPTRKNMNRIWINSMDEGERLITLQSLFDCYSALILLSSLSMLILAGYSVLGDNNQLLGILLIGMTMIISTFVYYRTAAKYNQ
ncbi:DUF3169 family protein [Macrococcus carouselicus]|uniref:DUF3169 family protein n=1 Tax=Macrococcus carouselicus TaxID=69969 RepID=A0A9Q8FP65_9STAP|nr:DUF3169 family protein [Macrococcus carouselicus]TDM00686.1 DUF3169 family protein [Macrococcus carouselicus]